MKKFFITLFILIILAGAAFMFGWAQFSVPPGQYGVIISKTHGIDPILVRSGEFRWVWYKLLPTNVHVAVFNLEQSRFPINFSSALPSGDTYASFAGIANADFSWNLRGEISFTIDPDMLVSLTEQQNLKNQQDLNHYLKDIATDIEVLILHELSSLGTDSRRLEQFMSGNRDFAMEREISNRFPETRDFLLIIHSARYPDFALYRQIRTLYEEFLQTQRGSVAVSFDRMAERHLENQLRFQELERYGDLLTRFPVLLDYFRLENNINENQ